MVNESMDVHPLGVYCLYTIYVGSLLGTLFCGWAAWELVSTMSGIKVN